MPCLSEQELRAKLKDTTEAKIILEKCGNPSLTSLEGIKELLVIAQKGGCLSAAQLEKLGMTLVSFRRMKAYLERGKAYNLSLPYYEENLDSLEELEQMTVGSLRNAVVDGDVINGSVMAGQSAGLVKEELTCKELINKLMKETGMLLHKEW